MKTKTKNAKALLSLFIITITLLTSCKKNISDDLIQQGSSSDAQTNSLQSHKATGCNGLV